MFPFLFPLVILVSLYDLKYRKVPNWVTLPLMLVGLYLSFPGSFLIWIASTFIFSAWKFGFIGGGDAKLWIGLLWCLSPLGDNVVVWMFVALLVTGVAQISVRTLSQKSAVVGFKAPGAWRTVVFMGLLAYLH
jgi:Flp pilus assembly protein protease CpaA